MKAARVRLALTLAVFLAWLGYLGYLVAERPAKRLASDSEDGEFVILSRPQLLVSDIDVIAQARKGSDTVTVSQVLFPATDAARELQGKEIKITNLADCRPPGDRKGALPDLSADGEYLLPLQDPGPDGKEYRVAVTPLSPGFHRSTPRIYPATKDVLAQYRQIRKE
jgi:hypothetical protein